MIAWPPPKAQVLTAAPLPLIVQEPWAVVHSIRRGPVPVSAQQLGLGRGTVGAVLVIPIRGVGSPGALMRSRPEEANGDTNRTWRSPTVEGVAKGGPDATREPNQGRTSVSRTGHRPPTCGSGPRQVDPAPVCRSSEVKKQRVSFLAPPLCRRNATSPSPPPSS